MSKELALGTKLYVESDTPGTYIAVGNLNSIGVPGPTKGEVEVTDFDSTAREYLATLPDNGEISFSGYFNEADAGQDFLFEDANDPAAPDRNFRIEFPRQGVEFEFAGFVKSFVPTAPGPDDAYGFDGSIRVTGAVSKGPIS